MWSNLNNSIVSISIPSSIYINSTVERLLPPYLIITISYCIKRNSSDTTEAAEYFIIDTGTMWFTGKDIQDNVLGKSNRLNDRERVDQYVTGATPSLFKTFPLCGSMHTAQH